MNQKNNTEELVVAPPRKVRKINTKINPVSKLGYEFKPSKSRLNVDEPLFGGVTFARDFQDHNEDGNDMI